MAYGEIYKYQDENGRWKFTDKKPADKPTETINYKSKLPVELTPILTRQKLEDGFGLMVENPFYAPMLLEITSEAVPASERRHVIAARSMKQVLQTREALGRFEYRWMLGDPEAKLGVQLYRLPVAGCPAITQAFNGEFSHQHEGSRYAVDIALPIGSPVVAARPGVVVRVKDDYHMGGTDEFFLDKANYVQVLHEDGTFAVYAHLLMGTAVVKPGDSVSTHTPLGKSGSSGYSTGPHLHFVVSHMGDFSYQSLAFQFLSDSGRAFTPVAGKTVCDF